MTDAQRIKELEDALKRKQAALDTTAERASFFYRLSSELLGRPIYWEPGKKITPLFEKCS